MDDKSFATLVVNRRVGERLRIGDDIILQLVEVQPAHQVRLGIEAPDEVLVLRSELYEEPPDIGAPSLKGLVRRIWRGNK